MLQYAKIYVTVCQRHMLQYVKDICNSMPDTCYSMPETC